MEHLAAFDLSGKTVFITGAGRGIGRGIAEVLAEAGADIALNALTSQYVEKTANDIATKTGRKIKPVLADMTDSKAVAESIDTVIRDFGGIDVLVNCLGDAIYRPLVQLPGRKQESITDEELKKIIDLNMTAAIFCTRAVGSHMLERQSGKIINISSYSAGSGGGNLVVYSLAKAAVVGLTRTQALEWAPYNIQINSIAPGLFPEPMVMTEQKEQNLDKWVTTNVPLKRAGKLREVGYLALYLASPASDYMTGQTLYLDGGLSL